jgi:hypothetical protein
MSVLVAQKGADGASPRKEMAQRTKSGGMPDGTTPNFWMRFYSRDASVAQASKNRARRRGFNRLGAGDAHH